MLTRVSEVLELEIILLADFGKVTDWSIYTPKTGEKWKFCFMHENDPFCFMMFCFTKG